MQVLKGKADGAPGAYHTICLGVECYLSGGAGEEPMRGSHFFTPAQVVLDIQIVSEPKL